MLVSKLGLEIAGIHEYNRLTYGQYCAACRNSTSVVARACLFALS